MNPPDRRSGPTAIHPHAVVLTAPGHRICNPFDHWQVPYLLVEKTAA